MADPDKNVLTKKQFFVTLEFEGNAVRAQKVEELVQIIPYPRDDDGSDYTSFIGVQLTSGQLEDIRRASGS